MNRTDERSSAVKTLLPDTSDVPRFGFIACCSMLLISMRPRQWTKNLAVFVGIVFAQQLLKPFLLGRVALAFGAFCLAASGLYLLNDLLDLEQDRQHPKKRYRPLAAGHLPVPWAVVAIGVLWLACIGLTVGLYVIPITNGDIFASLGGTNLLFTSTLGLYVVLMILYSVRLKHVVLLDVFVIASGFALRILAGAVVVPVVISPWLYIVTIMLSLLLALGKRRNELVLMEKEASNHRQILKEYTIPLLDQLITITTTATVLSYSLYTFQAPTSNHLLIITVPLVCYGTFRYLYLVYVRKEGGNPEEVLLRDRHMLGTVVLCIAIVLAVLYIFPS